ncbi:DUF4352 domain-containing protein [Halorutilales archaeon Cl-col2-1]
MSRIYRRRFLAALVTSALAGCTSVPGSGSGGNGQNASSQSSSSTSASSESAQDTNSSSTDPMMSVKDISAPDEIHAGDEFTVRLSVQNFGGDGVFEATLVSTKEEETVEKKRVRFDVGSGEEVTRSIDTSLEYSGNWSLGLSGSQSYSYEEETVEVKPVVLDEGGSYTDSVTPGSVKDEVRIRVVDSASPSKLMPEFETPGTTGSLESVYPGSPYRFVTAEIEVTNITDETVEARNLVYLINLYADDRIYDAKYYNDRKGSILGEIPPDESVRGVVAFEVLDDHGLEDVRLGWETLHDDENPEAYWDLTP